jgi:hypothetical protein
MKQYSGTIKKMNLEGGFWALLTHSGEKFRLTNLLPSFQKDGLHVRVTLLELREQISFYQWGTAAEVFNIELLEESQP